jgi:hypothetical protein
MPLPYAAMAWTAARNIEMLVFHESVACSGGED